MADRIPGFGAGVDLTGQPSPSGALANEILATVAEEIVVVLDDVQLLPEAAGRELQQLLRDAPPSVHLILTARSAVPLSLGRLRLDGLVELGAADLAVSLDEAGELLRLAGMEVSRDRLLDESGRWTLVLMNADASPGVAADTQLGVKVGILPPVSIGVLIAGLVILGAGVVMIVLGARAERPPAPGAAPEHEPPDAGSS